MSINQKVLTSIGDSVSGLYAGAFEASDAFIAMLTQVRKAYKGADVPVADLDYIATRVANQRNWKAGSMKVRRAELNTVIGQYATAPEAIALAVKQTKRPQTFSACLKICRALKSGKTSKQAAAVVTAVTKATAPNKRTKAVAMKSCKVHIKRILEHTQLSAAFRTELKKLAAEHDLLV